MFCWDWAGWLEGCVGVQPGLSITVSLGIFKCGVSVRPGSSDACLLGHLCPHGTARTRTLGDRLQPPSPCRQVADLDRAPSPSHCGYVEGEPADRARDLDGSGLLAQPSHQAVSRHRIRKALGL